MIAYFILVHRYPEQFKRLFNAIYNSSNTYLIHIDKKSNLDLYENVVRFLQKLANVHILNSQNVIWGGYSMVDVEMKAIKKLLQLNKKWHHFINLSGQDFPLKSQSHIQAFLTRNSQTSFLTIADQAQERPNTLNRIENYFIESESSFIGTPEKRAYLPDTTPYIGGQWKVLSRACCEFLVASPKVKKFTTFYKNTLIPDEAFFQTVLMNTDYTGKVINDDKRAIIWIPDFGPELLSKNFTENTTKALIESGEIKLRPKTLTKKDLTFLLKSKALFARKFDETIDSSILSILERRLDTTHASAADLSSRTIETISLTTQGSSVLSSSYP